MRSGVIHYWYVMLLVLLLTTPFVSHVLAQVSMSTLPQPESITYRQGLPQAFVPSIIQDKQGFIWMTTRDGLCRYDGVNFKVFQPNPDGKPGITSSSLSGIQLDRHGKIWIFSDENDVDILDPVTEKFTNISRQPFYRKQFAREILSTFFIDNQDRLWLSFLSNKVVCIEPTTNRIHHYTRPPVPGYIPTFDSFLQDDLGTIWMSNKTGLYRLDQTPDRFIRYTLPDNDIRGIYLRQNNQLFLVSPRSVMLLQPTTGQLTTIPLPANVNLTGLWHHTRITADSKENIYFNVYNQLFRFNENRRFDLLTELDSKTEFRGLFVDKSDVLWAGTHRIGLLKYNLNLNSFKAAPYHTGFYQDLFIQNLGFPSSPISKIAKNESPYFFRYTFDKVGKLWFNMGNNHIYQADLSTKQLTEIPFPIELSLRHLWNDPVTSMATDPSGHIWVLTDSLAVWYENGQWKPFPHPIRTNTLHDNVSQSISVTQGVDGPMLQLVVDDQSLWIASKTNGLYQVDRKSGQIRQYRHQPSDLTSLSSNQLFCLAPDPIDKTILWIGTFGNGLCRFNKRTGKSQRFTKQDGLPNNVIYAAIPDQQHFLWIATNQGICRLNRQTFQTRTYTHEDGLWEDEFNRFHFLHLPDDRIIMGGLGGITSFYPRQLRDDNYQTPVQITGIAVNNQPLKRSALSDSLPVQSLKKLELPYNQNFLTISFAALQYNSQPKLRYRYQLVGLNNNWVETSRPVAEYTDLRWGTYSLRLNVSNTSGIWSKHIRVLTLIIHPPWWATWWAILLYVLAFIGIVYGIVRTYLTEQEAKQLREIDALKARFFTNIAHEFRTPLTLIVAPTENLRNRLKNPEDQHHLDLINQNANQLLGLVDQLMDLAKAEAHVLKVNEVQGDLVEFLTQLIHSFEPQAVAKGIQLTLRADTITNQYWFDTDKLERIVSNLIANALKFTPMGGKVSVDLSLINRVGISTFPDKVTSQPSLLQLTIADNGIGVPPEQLPHIFDRFYRGNNSGVKYQEGTGIGLALVKELIEIQAGTIAVTSKVSIGTTFKITLPYRPAETLPDFSQKQAILQQKTIDSVAEETPVVLIVEDNAALSDFIADTFPENYRIHRAVNGADGLEKAWQLIPDLVISDVYMPVMDGYTLCNRLKKDTRTSHIPIILLTAKSSIDSRLEGLSLGADDYIAKPFHIQELQLRVRNLLEQRRLLRERIVASLTHPATAADSITIATDPLLDKLSQLIEQHLDIASFGAEELVLESGLSRMNLHRKLKALTGESTGEFIRNYRLKRAAQLLRQGYSVSETAYLVGFEDPSYFARSFRKTYQMTPSAYSNMYK